MKNSTKKVPKVLHQILKSEKSKTSLWGKGTGGGYPWRKK